MPADSESGSSQREHQRSDPMAEHKRRARWRLLGALIITGAVAAIAPVFLEDEARPLSQDLLIDIPSKNSAFTKIESLKSAPLSESTPTPVAPLAAAPSSAPAPEKQAPTTTVVEKQSPTAAPVAERQPPAVTPNTASKSTTAAKSVTPAPKAATPAEPKTAPSSGFLVQVGAYAKLESANAVRTKLVAGGHRVAIETIKAEDGTDRHRVRIGPFETREQALSVRDRARGQGYDAVVVNP